MDREERGIDRINFFHHQELLVKLGTTSDGSINKGKRRREVFEIANTEQMIGCKLDFDEDDFTGVTWLKIKLY